jgi:hypothetical protein
MGHNAYRNKDDEPRERLSCRKLVLSTVWKEMEQALNPTYCLQICQIRIKNYNVGEQATVYYCRLI